MFDEGLLNGPWTLAARELTQPTREIYLVNVTPDGKLLFLEKSPGAGTWINLAPTVVAVGNFPYGWPVEPD